MRLSNSNSIFEKTTLAKPLHRVSIDKHVPVVYLNPGFLTNDAKIGLGTSPLIQKYSMSHELRVSAMRHGVRTNRLGRPADQRKSLIRSLVTEVLTHGKINTTLVRAKYIRKYVDRMITLSKDGTLNARKEMERFIYNKTLVRSIMEEAPKRYASKVGTVELLRKINFEEVTERQLQQLSFCETTGKI